MNRHDFRRLVCGFAVVSAVYLIDPGRAMAQDSVENQDLQAVQDQERQVSVSAETAVAVEQNSTVQPVTPFIRIGGESKPRLMLSARSTFLYATFSPSIGASARFTGYTPVWNTGIATGTFDVGVVFAYSWGGKVMYPWVQDTATAKSSGADHNFRLAVSVGHSFYFGKERRHTFGVHVFTGVNFAYSRWCQTWSREGLSGCGSTTFTGLSFGPELEYVYRFSRHVGFNVVFGGAMPVSVGGPGGPMVHVGVGLTFFIK